MYKSLLVSIIALFAIAPVFGEYKAPEASEPQSGLTCDASGIGATTPNARMKASWTQNTYNLEWYGDDNSSTPLTVQNSAQSCDYGNTLVLPSTNPTKVGYTFIGWETEEIPAGFNYGSTCSSSVESTVAGNYAINGEDTPKPGCLDLITSDDSKCKGAGYDSNASTYGITEPGQWGVRFSYGDVIGEAICSSTSGTFATAGTPDTSGSGQYCWCRAMGYKLGVSNMCAVSSPAWVHASNLGSAAECAGGCAADCAERFRGTSDFRAALFGYSSSGSGSGSGSGSACLIPSTDVSTGGNAWAAKSLDGTRDETSGASMATYGITQPGEWGVSWANGDKVKGVALCSARGGNNHNWQWGGDSSDWTAGETELKSLSGKYCWCKVTHYTANNAEQCSLSSPSWVFEADSVMNTSCATYCARNCASVTNSYLGLRAALFGDNVAQ